jgi:hypothetical protein
MFLKAPFHTLCCALLSRLNMNTYRHHHHHYENHKSRSANFVQYLYKLYASKLNELQRTPLGACPTSWSTLSTILLKEMCLC